MVELVFVTSNNEKLAHARHLCRKYDVRISKQKQYGIGYKEPRIADRNELIEKSINDAYERWKKNISKADEKFIFIEDTSVIIPALSKEGKEFPGTDIKYWMQENDFAAIDRQLKAAGNDRTAIVQSDIALVLPLSLQKKIDLNSQYKIFTSSIKGRIIDEELPVETQPYYSWLSSKTFNKWFVPEGCDKPLSLLPIKLADQYDFRAGAFNTMLQFLEEYGIIKKIEETKQFVVQFDFFRPIFFIICGTTCAGKTTLALYLMRKYGYYHIEASDFMYMSYYERHGADSSVKISDFAEKALIVNPGIVANQIQEHIADLGDIPLVITGFRAIEEIICFKKMYSGLLDIEEIFVDASKDIRYERSKQRNRIDRVRSIDEFIEMDEQQKRMGLSYLRKEFKDNLIENNETFDSYYMNFENRFGNVLKTFNESAIKQNSKILRLEDVIIIALAQQFDIGEHFTTYEITNLINKSFPLMKKNKNNVSRYFNYKYHPYFDIAVKNGKKCYKLSQTGYSRANRLKNFFNN